MRASPAIRTARREDLPEILTLLADDDLGRGRERVDEDVLPATYLEAFGQITRDARNEPVVMEEGAGS